MTGNELIWAVIPAAGQGRRMGGGVPKQYLDLGGRPVIEHTIERFASHPRITGVVVCLAPEDRHWQRVQPARLDRIVTVAGGVERCHSVLNGLQAVAGRAGVDSWVMVHDAARPCVRAGDIDRLIDAAGADPVGAILAIPVRDTLKRVTAGKIDVTVDRAGLWHALTPQMFRVRDLAPALERALAAGMIVTDEAQALERTGLRPCVVEGHPDNIKITHPQDLRLALQFLRAQREEITCA